MSFGQTSGLDEEKVLRRHDSWTEMFKLWKTSFDELFGEWGDVLFLNDGMLLHCVQNYFQDIKMLKGFHEIRWADRHKRAAYTIKWISKIRPVQIGFLQTKPPLSLLTANSQFALFFGPAISWK